ncbi:MAG: Crp/Fnr family transcriptional regulator [Acidimicrobiales bacterium]
MDYRDVLARSEPFASLDASAVSVVAAAARVEEVERNAMIFAEGDPAETLYLVLSGRVAIANRSADGRESVVALMDAGDLFGEMGLFDGEGRSAGARALDLCSLLCVPYGPVRVAIEQHPAVLWDALALMARRLRTTDAALADNVFLDVLGRTAKRLLELSGGAEEFALPITQEELAGIVGASRERVNKAIATFVRLGWIDQRGRHYHIVRRDQLAQRSR